MIEDRPHASAGGRWLDDDILDELLTWMVNGGRRRAVRRRRRRANQTRELDLSLRAEPNNRTDLPLPAFLRSLK